MSTPTTPQDFKKKRSQGTIVELPSGSFIRCRGVDLATFIKQGEVPNALMSIINEALNKGESVGVEELTKEATENIDLEMVREMYEMIDQVVVRICIEPSVAEVPKTEAERDDEQLYVDELDDQDKMFLFQWSSDGTTDLSRFRKQSDEGMAALEESSGSLSKAE